MYLQHALHITELLHVFYSQHIWTPFYKTKEAYHLTEMSGQAGQFVNNMHPFMMSCSYKFMKYRLLHGKCARTALTHELVMCQKLNE